MYAPRLKALNMLSTVVSALSNKVTQLTFRLNSPTTHDSSSTIHALTGFIDGVEYYMVPHGVLVSCSTEESGHFSHG